MPGPQRVFVACSDGGRAAVPGDLQLAVDDAEGDAEDLGDQFTIGAGLDGYEMSSRAKSRMGSTCGRNQV
jgi:hypothetical protein